MRKALLLLGIVALMVPSAFAAGAKGNLTVNGKKIELKHAYAVTTKNPFDDKKTDVVVYMSDKELPAEALHDTFEMMKLQDDLKPSLVSIQINDEKSVNSGNVYSPNFKKMGQISGTGHQELEVTSWTKDRIAGKVSVAKHDFFDEVYSYDLTFDAPIVAKPGEKALPGTPLAAGGGEPGKAYEAYRKVLLKGDIPALKKAVDAARAKEMDSEEFKQFFPMIQEMTPKAITITGGAIDGDTATLKVVDKADKNHTGTITMVKQGGAWKVQKESWKQTN